MHVQHTLHYYYHTYWSWCAHVLRVLHMLPDLYMQAIGQLWNEMTLQQIISLQEYMNVAIAMKYNIKHL